MFTVVPVWHSLAFYDCQLLLPVCLSMSKGEDRFSTETIEDTMEEDEEGGMAGEGVMEVTRPSQSKCS